MTRYRWYKLVTSYDLSFILERLESMPFNLENKQGFKVDSLEDNKIYAQYFYAKSFNNEDEMLSIVQVLEFLIFKINDTIFLRIKNPSHGVKRLSDLLYNICNYKLAFSIINIKFSDCEELIKSYGYKSKVILIKINNLYLEDDLCSEMLFKSNNGVELSNINFLIGKDYRITQMTWAIYIDKSQYNLSLSDNGLLNVSEFLIIDTLNYIETHFLIKFI